MSKKEILELGYFLFAAALRLVSASAFADIADLTLQQRVYKNLLST